MYKIYNKNLKKDRSKSRLELLGISTLGLSIQITFRPRMF